MQANDNAACTTVIRQLAWYSESAIMPFTKFLAVSRCSGVRLRRFFSMPSALALERCTCASAHAIDQQGTGT